jgi:hypothetical protein
LHADDEIVSEGEGGSSLDLQSNNPDVVEHVVINSYTYSIADKDAVGLAVYEG